ncbi:MAG: hypothetical protein ACUVYA_00230, partial [Planctomycetota bacterium]
MYQHSTRPGMGRAGDLVPHRPRRRGRRQRRGHGPVREQTVEIALSPKRALEDGNIGTLTRPVPADRVVSAVPPPRGKPKPPKEPKTPRVLELLRKALEWQALLESGEASNQAAIARQEGITRAGVTRVMGLLRLAPEIQEHVLSLPDMGRRPAITERALRPPRRAGSRLRSSEALLLATLGACPIPTLAGLRAAPRRVPGLWRDDRGG